MFFFHPRKWVRLTKEFMYNAFWYYLLPDSWEITYHFKKNVGYVPNLKNPKSFNEKIQWLKLNDRDSRYPDLIDKFKVKDIVKEIIGDEYIIPTLFGPYYDIEDIPWSDLPEQYVIKCNHDAASVIICKDKFIFDVEYAKKNLSLCLKRNYYHSMGKQWGYKNIDRCVFVEQYVEDNKTHDLPDFKFYCFNGKVKCIFVGRERFTSDKGVLVNLYDRDWNKLPFEHYHPNYEGDIPRPKKLEKMIEIAEKLAKFVNNPFVRIDLYDVNEKIYFGEFTFYPGGGFEEFRPEVWDQILGSWIDLSTIKKG